MITPYTGRMFMLAISLCWPAGFVMAVDFDTTIDRDDHDAGVLTANTDPMALCELGLRSRAYHDPVEACRAAVDMAIGEGTVPAATRYASIGCNTYNDWSLCRRLGGTWREAER